MSDPRRNRRLPTDDAGFTLPELLIVVLLLGIVSALAMSGLASISTATARGDSRTEALAQARTAVEQISRDLRAANPIDAVDPVDDYKTRVSFSVYCSNAGVGSCSATNERKIVYSVVDHELRRTVGGTTTVVLGPRGPGSLPRNRQRGAIVNLPADEVFTYFDQNGAELSFAGTATNFRNCTKSVQIRLAVVSDISRPDREVDIATEVNLRNHNKVSNCTL